MTSPADATKTFDASTIVAPSPTQDSHVDSGIQPGDSDAEGLVTRVQSTRSLFSSIHGDHDGDLVTAAEDQDLKRGLGQRHLSMLGIAGSIGTGLFLGLGVAVQKGGPLGALLGYAVIGLVVCAVQFALGEVAALLPVTGSFVRHSEFLIDRMSQWSMPWCGQFAK